MTDGELLAHCRTLYEAEGPAALTFQALKAAGVYYPLYERGIRQADLIARLGIEDTYKAHKTAQPLQRNGKILQRWTWDRVVEEARQIVATQGNLPPAAWFQQNGHQSLVQAVYYLDRSWEALRDAVGDFITSTFVESRNGIRWRSHPEASLSNFLYTRGIEHRRGDRYPDTYAEETGRAYGFYDLHFLARDGWIDVEVWGENPGGHGEANYQAKRSGKEAFNARNSRFLGIEFRDCYDEARLSSILAPFIGTVIPYVFDRPTDRIIHSTHWSNSDELLEHCRALASEMPDGKFPTEEWLRKRGKWADRPGPAYNTLSVYIKTWIGGVRQLRDILGQAEASTTIWDRAAALAAWKAFWAKHGLTPSQVRGAARGGEAVDDATLREAGRLVSAIVKYADGADAANSALGIVPVTRKKWTRETILEGYERLTRAYGATPSQIVHDRRTGRAVIPDDDYRLACQLIDATKREFSGSAEVLRLIGFQTPSRKRKPRTKSATVKSGAGSNDTRS
ncbi:hypothetical protein [Caenibius tardaugens]|nr:hypothetical protein [Caenibius tardaugens]AZI37870.1 hypothetical protein EGO55_19465 [Caenibius tardaugens NBRC 16725]